MVTVRPINLSVFCKLHLLPWLVILVSFVCDVVAGSISSSQYTLLMIPNKFKTAVHVSICCVQVFAGFSGHGNSIHYIIPPLKKENVHLYGPVLQVRLKSLVSNVDSILLTSHMIFDLGESLSSHRIPKALHWFTCKLVGWELGEQKINMT